MQTDQRVYPMAISRVAAGQETEIVMYLLDQERQRPAEHTAVTIEPEEIGLDESAPSGTNYEALLLEKLETWGSGSVIVEYAGDWPGVVNAPQDLSEEEAENYLRSVPPLWPEAPFHIEEEMVLTRLRTVLSPQDMTFDYTFAADENQRSVENFFEIVAGRVLPRRVASRRQAALALFPWLLAPSGILLLRLRRRLRRRRHPGDKIAGGRLLIAQFSRTGTPGIQVNRLVKDKSRNCVLVKRIK